MSLFITNDCNYFFEVQCEINTDLLVGCTIHANEKSMVEYLCESDGYEMDEIEDNVIVINKNKLSVYHGHVSRDTLSVERFISEFQM